MERKTFQMLLSRRALLTANSFAHIPLCIFLFKWLPIVEFKHIRGPFSF